ncbi:hypothetical protein MNB_SV-4-403 [hydrothermal vent metagenome]|uniref:Uncharacterized protein n=1 Tax=hydrothermal vent metagenome TaxID=652676 RepID=A0A1W1EAN8_9ZZZZ
MQKQETGIIVGFSLKSFYQTEALQSNANQNASLITHHSSL